MAGTIARLRTGMIVAACLLLAALGAFFFVARWKARFLKRDLPRRLGVDIQQDSSGFTLSKSEHGHTLFTIHASRVVQLKDGGRAELHGVNIVLYGQGKDSGGAGAAPRQDKIQGDDFAYDPATQVVTAQGEVTIDLQAIGAQAQGIRLKTSGLTFDQKTGHAATTQAIAFDLPQIHGTAVGAEYDAERGLVTLVSQVKLQAVLDGGPATVTAANATLDRASQQIELRAAALHSAKHDARAGTATVWMRQDGSADHMVARGGVTLQQPDGTTIAAPLMSAVFDQDSHVRQAHGEGGVTLAQTAEAGAGRSRGVARQGSAREAWLEVGEDNQPASLRMAGDVRLAETERGSGDKRALQAGAVLVGFSGGKPQTITANQSPLLREEGHSAGAATLRTVAADMLVAVLPRAGNCGE